MEKETNKPDLITFKTEDSLWEMMDRGEKKWDARRYDLSDTDARIYRLMQFLPERGLNHMTRKSRVIRNLEPVEKRVGFVNVKTKLVLIFEYRRMEFTPWSPGWCFLILGELVIRVPLDTKDYYREAMLGPNRREASNSCEAMGMD